MLHETRCTRYRCRRIQTCPYRTPLRLAIVQPVHFQQPLGSFSTLFQNRCFSSADNSGISSAFDISLDHPPIVSQHHPPVPRVYWHVNRRLIRVHEPTHFVGESRVRVYHPVAISGTTSTDPYEISGLMHRIIRVASHTTVMQARRNAIQWFPAYHASRLVALRA